MMSGMQLQMIMDCMSRARAACNACHATASSGIRGFAAESATLDETIEVFASWIRQETGNV